MFSCGPIRNILLKIEYDGTNYSGWQTQHSRQSTVDSSRKETIQETIEKALEQILQEKVNIISSGRTDAGVHALSQFANFKTESKIPPVKLRRALNSVLPKDIVIKEAGEVPLEFHSRFDAKSKIYRYTIINGPSPSAISANFTVHIPYKLNIPLMKKEAKLLVGKRDFKSFQASDAGWSGSPAPRSGAVMNRGIRGGIKRSSIRTIKKLVIKKSGDTIIIDVEADGFLYNMVRNIAGTLIDIGRGRIPAGSMSRILKARDRKSAGTTAPARGLCLMEVRY